MTNRLRLKGPYEITDTRHADLLLVALTTDKPRRAAWPVDSAFALLETLGLRSSI